MYFIFYILIVTFIIIFYCVLFYNKEKLDKNTEFDFSKIIHSFVEYNDCIPNFKETKNNNGNQEDQCVIETRYILKYCSNLYQNKSSYCKREQYLLIKKPNSELDIENSENNNIHHLCKKTNKENINFIIEYSVFKNGMLKSFKDSFEKIFEYYKNDNDLNNIKEEIYGTLSFYQKIFNYDSNDKDKDKDKEKDKETLVYYICIDCYKKLNDILEEVKKFEYDCGKHTEGKTKNFVKFCYDEFVNKEVNVP
ncbi:hypothetical protein A0H76_2161 [Hepatospora eriocheir]|uniref:Uncharacterized protein n=1 Tax=Hepatospora eriocheir TaxID=1081669 RepID=A0A1X0QFP1_9MICR|nr:hypothetical protein A0H76_2161 [Hepatospora eriocheir]